MKTKELLKNEKRGVIKEMPVELRPRERLIKYGACYLSDYELLAIILRTGTKEYSVLELARRLIIEFKSLSEFKHLTVNELCKVKGIKEAKAVEVLAAIELGKRINNYVSDKTVLKRSRDVYDYIRNELEFLQEERFICIYLTIKSEVIETKVISVGSISSTSFDLKKVLKWAIKLSSSHVVFVHNHPTGDPTPSKEDVRVTEEAIRITEMLDIKIVDHIIIGVNKYFSFTDKNIFKIKGGNDE